MPDLPEFARIPGLYRLWDLQFVFDDREEYQVHYTEMTEDGASLFAVYRRRSARDDAADPEHSE